MSKKLALLGALQKLRRPSFDGGAWPALDPELEAAFDAAVYAFFPDFADFQEVLASRDQWRATAQELAARLHGGNAGA